MLIANSFPRTRQRARIALDLLRLKAQRSLRFEASRHLVALGQPYRSSPRKLMMVERPSKSDQLRTFREARVVAAERAKATSKTSGIRNEEPAALKKLEQDE